VPPLPPPSLYLNCSTFHYPPPPPHLFALDFRPCRVALPPLTLHVSPSLIPTFFVLRFRPCWEHFEVFTLASELKQEANKKLFKLRGSLAVLFVPTMLFASSSRESFTLSFICLSNDFVTKKQQKRLSDNYSGYLNLNEMECWICTQSFQS
jgi:hypothetical protein